MATTDGAKRAKPPARPPQLQHKRLGDAYVAELVSLGELLRFVHSWGQGEAALAWVASRQLALITVAQLHVAGVGRGGVRRRRENGSVHPMYRGVYLVGHSVSPPGALELGAVLTCGQRTLISHESAAGLWGFAKPPPGDVEVTVIARGCRSRAGLRVHQVETLAAADRGQRNGIPITAPARAAIDYAATVSAQEAERAMAEAFALRLVTDRSYARRLTARRTAPVWRAPARSSGYRADRPVPARAVNGRCSG
jgi:predicted transcriptional regulator of viral defense system